MPAHSRQPRTSDRLALSLWAVPLAATAVAVVETARLPVPLLKAHPLLALQTLGAAVLYSLLYCFPAAALQYTAWGARHRQVGSAVFFAATGGAALALACAAGYAFSVADRMALPTMSGPAALVGAVGIAWALAAQSPRVVRTLSLLGALGFVAFGWLNDAVFIHGYTGLHLVVLNLSFMCAVLATDLIPPKLRTRTAGSTVGIAIAVLCFIGLSSSTGRRHLRAHTWIGKAPLVFSPLTTQPASRQPAPTSPNVFATRNGLPDLPASLAIGRMNIVFVQWEATPFRHTTLADSTLTTTPELARFARGAMNFSRAYSSSANTFQSTASILAMGPPSALPLATSVRRWRGRLEGELTTIPEMLARVGIDSVWIGVDYNKRFTTPQGILGVHQGFKDLAYLDIDSNAPEADRHVVERAAKEFQTREGRPFFAWVTLSSPHEDYVRHGQSRAKETPFERYAEELRYADTQFGVLLDTIGDLGLADSTIIIVTADHGEEFSEHGRTGHGSTLYEEIIHVPLVVRIPGIEPHISEAPTSNAYVLPWLLSHPSSAIADQVRAHVSQSFAPIMEATGGAVVAELIGRHRMLSALVYPNRKLHYDWFAELLEIYELSRDPNELRPIGGSDDHIDAYLAYRIKNTRALID